MTVDYGGVCTTTKSVILALPPSVGEMAAAMLHLPRPLFEDAAAAAVEMKQLQPAFEVDVASVKHSHGSRKAN